MLGQDRSRWGFPHADRVAAGENGCTISHAAKDVMTSCMIGQVLYAEA